MPGGLPTRSPLTLQEVAIVTVFQLGKLNQRGSVTFLRTHSREEGSFPFNFHPCTSSGSHFSKEWLNGVIHSRPPIRLSRTCWGSFYVSLSFFMWKMGLIVTHQGWKMRMLCLYLADVKHIRRRRFGEGNDNPLQCSCLENPRDGGAWGAAVYGVAQSWVRLKWLSSSSLQVAIWEKKLIYSVMF